MLVTLPATDADGETVTYTAACLDPATIASELRDQLRITSYVSWLDNYGGAGRRWFTSSDMRYYYLDTDGSLYRFQAYQADDLSGQVDPTYTADPTSFLDAQAGGSLSVAVTVNGNELTIDPAANFEGTFVVEVTVTDGAATVQDRFQVTVTPA